MSFPTNIQTSFTALAKTVLSYSLDMLRGIGKLITCLISVRQSEKTMTQPKVLTPGTEETMAVAV